MDDINTDPGIVLTDDDLKSRGIDPNRIRRWFKKHYDMTFRSFLRLYKITSALGKIKSGEKIIETAFESGYESLSGFTESFPPEADLPLADKKTTGFSPGASSGKQIIFVSRILTPLGQMMAGSTEKGICFLYYLF